MAGAAGFFLKKTAEAGIGSEENSRDGVEAGAEVERGSLDGGGDSRAALLPEMAEEPVGSLCGVLMDVGVPGSGQGQMKVIGQDYSCNAVVARAGDVHDVRPKFLQSTDY